MIFRVRSVLSAGYAIAQYGLTAAAGKQIIAAANEALNLLYAREGRTT